MEAGRELDRKIAELLGWTDFKEVYLSHLGYSQLQGVMPGEVASPYTGFKPKHYVPEYSTDIKAAWEVVEKLCPKEDEFRLKRYYQKEWFCTFAFYEAQQSYAKTAPHAICLAAIESIKSITAEPR